MIALAIALALAIAAALVLAIMLARAKAAARSAEAALDQARASAGAREKLFDAVVDTAPMAIVLLGDRGRIAFTNREARELFFEGLRRAGMN
ncbi:MAG: hypothetical protein ACXVEF_42205 [Polyangiales bacterium]